MNIVFTYNVVVNKVEKVKVENPDYDPAVEGSQEYIEQTVALKGAGFTLYKKNAEGDYVAVGAEIKGTEMTTFTWNRLDDGDYKLVETTVPAGYNKMLDIEFTITAEHDLESDDPQLTKLEGGNLFTGNITTGTLTTDVENIPGAELPETGGMGTTMIYVIGCLMVAGAAIVLFAKKRAAK